MGLFGVSEKQFSELQQRISDNGEHLDRITGLLEALRERTKVLESAPGADGAVDALAATVDRAASEASAASRSHDDALEDLDRRIVTLTLATAEGIERVDRAERRIRNTVQRARKELAAEGFESPGLEAEAAELRLVDGSGGEEEGLPPVREGVVPDEPQPAGIPGHFDQETLRNLRSRA